MKKTALLLLVILLTAAPAFAQKSFDMRYSEAVEYYTTKQYDKAIKVLEASKKSPGVTKDQINKANRLLNQCKAAKQKLSDLNLSKETLYFPGSGQTDSIYVTAGKAWEVTSSPDWVTARKELDLLYIEAAPNPLDESRKGIVEVSMGKERTAYVVVNQDQRQSVSRTIRIHTDPDRAFIYIDREPGVLSDNFFLLEGRHDIRIEKNGYERKDTTIVVRADVDDAENEYSFRLSPQFATVSVNIVPEEGYSFDTPPVLDISGNVINLHPSVINNFGLDKDLSYYELYEGGLIPLHPGQYTVKVGAEGFTPQSANISVGKGENASYDFTLVPICGFLTVADQEYAAGAKVFMDGAEIGTVPVSNLRVKSGRHVLSFRKEGFLTMEDEYPVDVQEGKELTFKAFMHRFVTCNVSSEPDYCKVYLDGKYLGSTPLDIFLTEGEHKIRYEKAGYFPLEETVRTDFSNPSISRQISLSQSFPLLVTADKDSLGVTIWKGSGDNRVVYAENAKTPARVSIPLSDTPYRIELTRNNLKTAYKGSFKFKDEADNHVNILSWGDEPPMFGLTIAPDFNKDIVLGKGYSRLGDARLVIFKIFPGLSSAVAKTSLFWENDHSMQVSFPEKTVTDIDGQEHTLQALKTDGPAILPAFSLLFINEEFRIGGGITQHVDANALLTYTWYPNLSKIFSFSHMSGHEVFLGAEINSRLPIFNGHLKIGMEGLFGQANIYYTGQIPETETTFKKEQFYYTEALEQPIRFVVGLGFTIGGKEAKGQNMLRVF
ncbi:MAG: PEGA domain-containing protein [Bacteroidales bacterium]|nr:PEGA domain-containing protein [Bacteroidales bacterium]